MTSPDVEAPEDQPTLTTHPLLGIAEVLLDAMIATCTGPLMNVDSADIRGAMHFVVAFMSTVPTQYRQVVAAPVEAK